MIRREFILAGTRRKWWCMWRTRPVRAKEKRPPRRGVAAESLVALAEDLLTPTVLKLNAVRS
jgi:hypothetical protein